MHHLENAQMCDTQKLRLLKILSPVLIVLVRMTGENASKTTAGQVNTTLWTGEHNTKTLVWTV